MAGFSFTNSAGGSSGAGSGGLFGTTNGTTPTSSVFGSTTPATTKPGGLFGGGASSMGNTGGVPLFGGVSTGVSFGGDSGSKPASGASTPSLFGGNNNTSNAPAGGMFGQQPSTTTSSSTTGSVFGSAGASGGGGFSFGAKDGASTSASIQSTPANTQAGSLFSGAASTGGNLFASATPGTSTATPAGLTTPAAPKFSFNTSTTPAGPPPAENSQAKPLFGSTTSGQQPLFGTTKPAESAQTKASSLFPGLGGGPANPASTGSSTGGLFGNTAPTSASPAVPASTAAPKSLFNFAPAASTPGTQASTTGAATAPTTSSTTSAPAASSLFSGLSSNTTTTAPPTSTSTSTSASAPASKPLFGNLGGTPASSAATSSTAPAASTMFGPPKTNSATQPAATAGMPTPGVTQAVGANPPLGSSTSGPIPQQSRLKNKTMDEIITRWASDLLKYQKEFQEQANKVATWDRLLVENGEKIQVLSDQTHEAERAQREIESQLSTVEGQQDDLTSWLDRYEADVDEMFARQVGPGDNLQGPDQERERTYKIAEKLTDRLDEMGKNITSMIEAINDASSNVSKHAKTDDPLSHIVRVLNSHLTQLQWIDQNTEVLQAKVTAAQKMGQSLSSNGNGALDESAETFYRSFANSRR